MLCVTALVNSEPRSELKVTLAVRGLFVGDYRYRRANWDKYAVSLSDPAPAVIVCALAGNMWPGKKRVDQAFVCEGADENSWQSRPRHAVLSPTPGRLPPPRETARLQRRRRSRPSRNASAQRDGSLQRQDGVRHFLLSCSRPAAT